MLINLNKQEPYKIDVNGEIVSAIYTGEYSSGYYIFITLKEGGGEGVGVSEIDILKNNPRVEKCRWYN